MKYVIKWTATRTGKVGYGTGTFSKEQAEKEVKSLNKADTIGVRFEAVPEQEIKKN